MKGIGKLWKLLPAWFPTLLTVAAVLWLTLAPHPTGEFEPELFPGADKAVHALMFGWLALMVFIDRVRLDGKHAPRIRFFVVADLFVILLGGIIEILQGLMELGRSADFSDFLADAAGAATVLLLWLIYWHKHKNARCR